MAPKTLITISVNFSIAFPTSLLTASASLPNYPLSFDGEPPVHPPPSKTTVMVRTNVEIVIERAVSIENIVIPCSRKKVRILSAKDVSLSRTFSGVCLILATLLNKLKKSFLVAK